MTRRARWMVGVTVGTLLAAGAVVAQAVQEPAGAPANAPADPVGDAIQRLPVITPPPAPTPVAPTPAPVIVSAPQEEVEPVEDPDPEPVARAEAEQTQPEETEEPQARPRRPIAIVQAVDKITAETMRFEVEVGGRPVRFNGALIFTARACEVAAPDERDEEAAAYLGISLQPRGAVQPQTRQLFRGWMFASTPGLSSIEHPVYDAWVVGCRA